MEIQAAKLLFTDADLAGIAEQHVPKNESIEGVKATFTAEGVLLQGQYATGFGFKVPFETLWQVSAAGPALHVKLDSIKVAGLPGGMLRTVLMRMIRDAVEARPGVRVLEETIQIDVPVAAKAHGGDIRVNFTAVRLSVGAALVEAG